MPSSESNYAEEIIVEIVDNVAAVGDAQYIQSCSLISSAFQHRAQSHLFHTGEQ